MTWYLAAGPEGDLIVSSRIRLARNLEGYPFGSRLAPEQATELLERIRSACRASGDDYLDIRLEDLSPEEQLSLVERRLISPELLEQKNPVGLLLGRDESIAIMLGEEDHIRIQSMRAGLDLIPAWEAADAVARIIESRLPIAWSERYGFLTACPTNVGTGLRASVMMHLPALTRLGQIEALTRNLSKLGFTVRGYHGEHSRTQGCLVQISNQLTLGIRERELLGDLGQIVEQMLQLERRAREQAFGSDDVRTADRVQRAIGILGHARLITSEEALDLLSDLRLGVELGIAPGFSAAQINSLMIQIEPGTLQKSAGRPLEAPERDARRADILRGAIAAAGGAAAG